MAIYRCKCGVYFNNKGRLIQHCALLTDDWPAKSIWNNPDHHPVDKEEYWNRRNAAYRRLKDDET